MSGDYRVADIGLAGLGRKQITLAEYEMPALMGLRRELHEQQPLRGARILGCLHMTVQTAVLIETLVALGAQVRWSSCNRFSTQDDAAAAMAEKGIPVYAWKGESEEEYMWCLRQSLRNGAGEDDPLWEANILLDDGGDLTQLVHDEYPEMLPGLHGVSEETTTGVARLLRMVEHNSLAVPAIDVNAAVTKSKNDNRYGCRHSLNDAIKRGTDMLLAGRHALVIGYGDVGKGSAASLRQESALVCVAEVDPICAMQAVLDGYEVVSPWLNGANTGREEDINLALLQRLDLVVTATGNVRVCDMTMLRGLKKGCVVCNIGHFDNEIDTEGMRAAWQWEEIKPQVHCVWRNGEGVDGDYLLLLSEGRLVNLGNATGHPSRVMDGSFANQVLAQIHLLEAGFANLNDPQERAARIKVEPLPRDLDEKVARLMIEGQGAVLTRLSEEQSEYLGIQPTGPFKPFTYRY